MRGSEGYHLPDKAAAVDLLPKGLEIRTPVSGSTDECLGAARVLHQRLHDALSTRGLRAVVLSLHPTQDHFEGFGGAPLNGFAERLESGRVPADEIVEIFRREVRSREPCAT